MKPITEIAENLGLDPTEIIPYGRYKAKIPLSAQRNTKGKGKLVVVTGITPTPAGEGKTTTTVGLAQGFGKLRKNVVATLREPSLGPIFGIKGGGTGGGVSMVEPQDEVNIHFTGDAHAVGSAHNLLAALTDNVAERNQIPGFVPSGVTWRRVTDMEHRSLRTIVSGLGGSSNGPVRETGFDIVTASEIMAILALASDLENLRDRLGKILVGFTLDGSPVTAFDIGAVGSMMSLLRHAIQPNLVQTTEGQPVIVHSGPFGNIAHGCSSVIGDSIGLGYADYVLTEAGFGADLGFEKFMHIKARFNDLEPNAAVIVASARALKSHGGVLRRELAKPNIEALEKGVPNLTHLIGMVKSFNLPVVVAINRFPDDTSEEISTIKSHSEDVGAFAAVESLAFTDGGLGTVDLAEAVIAACEGDAPNISYLYPEDSTPQEKVKALAQNVYNARDVFWPLSARRQLRRYSELGWGNLPICMAKTQLSISHNSRLKGCPSDYTFEISDVRISPGAGFIYPIAGNVVTMPGLPANPRSLDIDAEGSVIGL